MIDIFLSYDDKDRPRARALAEALEEQGWSIFWDRSIPAGKTWWQAIGRALKGARSVVVLWSETSVLSTWVYEEADAGHNRNVLIPVFIDIVPPPIGFRSIQAVDLSAWDGSTFDPGYRKLLADIEAVIGAKSEAATAEGGPRSGESGEAAEPVADAQENAYQTGEDDDYCSSRFYMILAGLLIGCALALYLWG